MEKLLLLQQVRSNVAATQWTFQLAARTLKTIAIRLLISLASFNAAIALYLISVTAISEVTSFVLKRVAAVNLLKRLRTIFIFILRSSGLIDKHLG